MVSICGGENQQHVADNWECFRQSMSIGLRGNAQQQDKVGLESCRREQRDKQAPVDEYIELYKTKDTSRTISAGRQAMVVPPVVCPAGSFVSWFLFEVELKTLCMRGLHWLRASSDSEI